MQKVFRCRIWSSCLVLFVLFLAGGCASTKGSYNMVPGLKADEQIASYAHLQVDLRCNDDVSLAQSDQQRILNLIVNSIPTECPNRYKVVNGSESDQRTLHALVKMTKYDEGNAFARFMLAGLGQMHIDAIVALSDLRTDEELGKYEVAKTFAWGGIYGGSTGIRNIEDGFAKAVAASLCAKKEGGG